MMKTDYIQKIVSLAIEEDIGTGDITANLLPFDTYRDASVITREAAILCGIDFVEEVYRQIDPRVVIEWQVREGQQVAPNQILCYLKGPVRSLLTGERNALNFLQTLSGTATTTRRFVNLLKDTDTQLLDTRKTIPGLRLAQKYAVKCGGGNNHRLGLYDAYLIKENHIAACGSIQQAIKAAREMNPEKILEIEVENLYEFEEALRWRPDIILLDNFTLLQMQQAVELNAGCSKLEVSGNVIEAEIKKIAATGVDFISVGALTKHIKAVDLSMRLAVS
jgi:nicotinate-nucleotide pyrophosphorylase (carboxylating)